MNHFCFSNLVCQKKLYCEKEGFSFQSLVPWTLDLVKKEKQKNSFQQEYYLSQERETPKLFDLNISYNKDCLVAKSPPLKNYPVHSSTLPFCCFPTPVWWPLFSIYALSILKSQFNFYLFFPQSRMFFPVSELSTFSNSAVCTCVYFLHLTSPKRLHSPGWKRTISYSSWYLMPIRNQNIQTRGEESLISLS